MQTFAVRRLEAAGREMREQYQSARPFPHVVVDEFLDPDVLQAAIEAFPPVDPERWINWVHFNERKFGNREADTWPPALQSLIAELNSPPFVQWLVELTGIEGMIPDESLEGGGLHQSLPGGFLNVHADFTVHPHHRTWRRRVNLLLFLNADWSPEYGGDLEFWSKDMSRCEKSIQPISNRAVIFNTDPDSFHGHPEPLRCPPGMSRKSIALYYFTHDQNPLIRSTEYRARPGDGARAALIYIDNKALHTYDRVKRMLHLSDKGASRLLRLASRLTRRRPESQV